MLFTVSLLLFSPLCFVHSGLLDLKQSINQLINQSIVDSVTMFTLSGGSHDSEDLRGLGMDDSGEFTLSPACQIRISFNTITVVLDKFEQQRTWNFTEEEIR